MVVEFVVVVVGDLVSSRSQFVIVRDKSIKKTTTQKLLLMSCNLMIIDESYRKHSITVQLI